MAVRLAQGDTMVAIPGVRYRLPCVFGDTTCEMKGCLHCKCFSSTKFVKWREIHGAARRAVVFPCYDHAVAPGHGLAVWHTPSASSRRRSPYTLCCQCRGALVDVWHALGVAVGSTWISTGGPSMQSNARWGLVLHVEAE